MDAAASLPAATARTARSGPVTASPPANTPGRFVASVFGSAAMPHFESVSCARVQRVQVHALPDGRNDAGGLHLELRAGDRHRAGAPAFIRRPQFHPLAGEAQLARLALQPHRGDEEVDLDALGLGRFDFLHEARHLAARAAVEHAHGLRAQPHGTAAGVHGGVAAAHDDDVAAHGGRRAIGELFEKLQRGRGQLFAGAAQAARALGADRQEHGVEVPPQVVQREVPAQPFAQAEFGAQVADHLDFRIEHLPRQAKRRDAIAQHPARLRVRVKQHRAMTPAQQMMRRRQPRRPGPDDGHSPASRRSAWRRRLACGLGGRPRPPLVVGSEAMQVADRERLLHVALPAALLAQPRANPPQRRRQREIVRHNLGGLPVVAGGNAAR